MLYFDVENMEVMDANGISVPVEDYIKYVGRKSKSKNPDEKVDHPNHYQSKNGLEAIDIMEEYCMDLPGDQAISNSNVIKYILRWHKKNGLEDLKKAQWYLNRLIEQVERNQKEDK